MITWKPEFVTELAKHEVFVFGSNELGEHGGGSACHAHRSGWAVWGCGRGFQRGPHGASYAVVTIRRGGLMRSMDLGQIRRNVKHFLRFAANNPALSFIVAPLGENLAGWTREQIKAEVWDKVERMVPPNVRFVRPPQAPPRPPVEAECEDFGPVTCPECGEYYESYLDLDVAGACNSNLFCLICHCEFDPVTGEIHRCQKPFEVAAELHRRGLYCDGKKE